MFPGFDYILYSKEAYAHKLTEIKNVPSSITFYQFTGLQEDNSLSTDECLQLQEAGFPLGHDQYVSFPAGFWPKTFNYSSNSLSVVESVIRNQCSLRCLTCSALSDILYEFLFFFFLLICAFLSWQILIQ